MRDCDDLPNDDDEDRIIFARRWRESYSSVDDLLNAYASHQYANIADMKIGAMKSDRGKRVVGDRCRR